ncbi:hypothetical protein NE237_008648 [Protea cynaroides]|uniref:Uncharacterized protein n=1 Tax=Protea cynaroides TaxID=273540 RepID=A0A9Q0KW35_9MAGN|nr:hypothetical protein NE237_008648 [Protea cynaroides]
MSPTMEKRKIRATSMAERAAVDASKAEKETVPQRKSERLAKEAPRRKVIAAKSFEQTKDPQPEGRGQRKDADVQTPTKRKAKTTKSSVSGFKRLRKDQGIPTTSGTPSKEYNEVEVRNEITEMMVDDGGVVSIVYFPTWQIKELDSERGHRDFRESFGSINWNFPGLPCKLLISIGQLFWTFEVL